MLEYIAPVFCSEYCNDLYDFSKKKKCPKPPVGMT